MALREPVGKTRRLPYAFIASLKISDSVKVDRGSRASSGALFQHSVLESILHQLGARLHAEVLHDGVFVKGHGAGAYLEEVRDFLHPAAFRPAERPIGARFIELNDLALSRFSKQECRRIGVHTCLGSDGDLTHSADVDYVELLPRLFELQVGFLHRAC